VDWSEPVPVSGAGQFPSDWPTIVKAITGHALCDTCIAADVREEIGRVRDVLRRLKAIFNVEANGRCERCERGVEVYEFMGAKRL